MLVLSLIVNELLYKNNNLLATILLSSDTKWVAVFAIFLAPFEAILSFQNPSSQMVRKDTIDFYFKEFFVIFFYFFFNEYLFQSLKNNCRINFFL